MEENNKEIQYIAKHYHKGLFATEPALRRIKSTGRPWWTPAKIAAASVVVVVMGATAAVLIHNSNISEPPAPTGQVQPSVTPAETVVRVIDFEETPLTIVVAEIRNVYGVEVTNLPENADDYKLSLHYEGSATDLVETINAILDTDMKIKK
ncbi:MAG: hypothetical protein K2K26_07870 [Muribaculaceae bacterium]|nr:hypothetical protein [Muribaculaceae bacterium]